MYIYFALAVAAIASLLLAALRPLVGGHPPNVWARLTPGWLFLLLVVVTMLAWRWPAMLSSQATNPDEALFLAEAHLATMRPIPWHDFDATTSGPFNVWPITAAHLLGAGFTYATARLIGVALLLGGVLALYRSAQLLLGEGSARLSVLCIVSFFATASYDRDFVHYSSETVPFCQLALLALAAVKLSRAQGRSATVWSAAAGLLAASVPFAKLQAAPIDAAMIVVVLATCALRPVSARKKAQDAVSFLLGALTVTGFVLVPVVLSGAWRDFLISYILAPLTYIRSPVAFLGSAKTHLYPGGQQISILDHPSFLLFAFFSGMMIVVALTFASRRRFRVPAGTSALHPTLLVICVSLVATATYAVIKPNEPFGHYLLLLVFPISAFTAYAFWIVTSSGSHSNLARSAIAVLASTLVCSSVALSIRIGSPFLAPDGSPKGANTNREQLELTSRVSHSCSIAVWGWSPEVYVFTGAIMGTRDAMTLFQMSPGPFQNYYLSRYVGDLQRHRPFYFLDTVRPGWYHLPSLTVPADRHDHAGPVARYVRAHYDLVAEVNGMRLYRLRQAMQRTRSHAPCLSSPG